MKPRDRDRTVQLAPVEIDALLQTAQQAPDPTAPTVEMIPLDKPIVDTPEPPRLARGTRRPRATLRVEEIVRPKKKR